MSEKITLNPNNWKPKSIERGRDRMKITFKLNAEDSLAWKNWSVMAKPDDTNDEDFIKSIFFAGIKAYTDQLNANVQKAMQDPEVLKKLEEAKLKDKMIEGLKVPEEVMADENKEV